MPLCLIPRKTINSNPDHRCIKQILSNSSISILKPFCEFTCYPESNYAIITKILPNKFLITNILQNITVMCPKRILNLPTTPSGTLEILPPCNCTVQDGHTELISSLSPCDSRDHPSPTISYLLPLSWSKFQTLTIFPLDSNIRHKFYHLDEILNENWTLNTPTYFVLSVIRQDTLEHIHLKNTFDDIFNNTVLLAYIFLAWSAILTVFVLILAYCVRNQHIRLKMLQPPPRDYTLQEMPPQRR